MPENDTQEQNDNDTTIKRLRSCSGEIFCIWKRCVIKTYVRTNYDYLLNKRRFKYLLLDWMNKRWEVKTFRYDLIKSLNNFNGEKCEKELNRLLNDDIDI